MRVQCGFQCRFQCGLFFCNHLIYRQIEKSVWDNPIFCFLEVQNEFPSRRNHIFHMTKPYLSQGKTLSFTRQNLIFCKAKPYLLQGETLSFARRNLIFHMTKPYLSPCETISFARRNHIFHRKYCYNFCAYHDFCNAGHFILKLPSLVYS